MNKFAPFIRYIRESIGYTITDMVNAGLKRTTAAYVKFEAGALRLSPDEVEALLRLYKSKGGTEAEFYSRLHEYVRKD